MVDAATGAPDLAGACGYAHGDYARSLSEFGEPLELKRASAWLLTAAIGGTGSRDAFGPYPLFSCEYPDNLVEDLRELSAKLVSVYAVSDPLRDGQLPAFRRAFDFVRPYKPHFIVDLSIGFSRYMRRHHRRYAKRAFEQINVEHAGNPVDFVDEWNDLYSVLAGRHAITGLRRFSRESFRGQLGVKGCHYFRAMHRGQPVGGFICYLDRDRAYAHLIAASPLGQSLLAQYALYWTAIETLRGSAREFNLGGVPGDSDGDAMQGGLAFFKAGWATASRPTHFCGSILDKVAYERLKALGGSGDPGHFPAYRSGILGTD